MKKYLIILFAILMPSFMVQSCSDFDREDVPSDWSEDIIIEIDSKLTTASAFGGHIVDAYLVKEPDDTEWKKLYHYQIEGFAFEEGYCYILKVKKTYIVNPPADGLNVRYELMSIESKVKVE